MTGNTQAWEAWQVELSVALVPAFILLDTGADFHLPWWGMLLVIVPVVAFLPRELAALRHDGTAIGKALLFGTGYWLLWEVGCWLGENGAEWLHRGWRWWIVAVALAAAFRAWEGRHARYR